MKKLSLALKRLRIRAHKRYTPLMTTYPGFTCLVPDKSSFLSMCDEIFDREIYRFKTETTTPRILDCGANIGLAAIYWKRFYPAADITCFEPDPTMFEALTHNLKSAGVGRITLVKAGLGSKKETRNFFREGADGGRIATAEDNHDIISIDIVPLSPYLETPVDLLKIDIEGSEFEVLTECAARLGNVRSIFVEYHSLHSIPQDLAALLKILTDAGFRFYIEDTGVHSKHPLVSVETHLGYDNQLNIFGYRV